MNRTDLMAATSAGGALITCSLSLGDWASIAAIAAASFSAACSLKSLLFSKKQGDEKY